MSFLIQIDNYRDIGCCWSWCCLCWWWHQSVRQVVRQPVVQLTKDGSPYREYAPDSVQQPVYQALLRHMYRLYRLLRGTLAAQSREQLLRSTAAIFDSVSRAAGDVDSGGGGWWWDVLIMELSKWLGVLFIYLFIQYITDRVAPINGWSHHSRRHTYTRKHYHTQNKVKRVNSKKTAVQAVK